jgi:Family of unknown function (DUF5522)
MKEGIDYIIENGLWIFTKEYHLKRGYCCKNACQNCPWDYAKKLKEQSNKNNKLDNKQ